MLCAREVRGAPAISCSNSSAQALCGSPLSPHVHSNCRDFTFIPATFAFAGSPEPGRLLLPGGLLLFLQTLLLLNVSLLQLFRLPLMPLLHLLLSCFAGLLLRQPLMFLILLLLQFLAVLLLLRKHFLLLLLVFTIAIRVA